MPSRLRAFFAAIFGRSRFEAEMAEELAFHLRSRTDALIAHGLPPDEAARQARIEFGGLEAHKDRCRDARGTQAVETILRDVRYALRQLRRSPGFAAAAILTLALGIGATTAIFSVVNRVLLQPLPFPQPDRLFALCSENQQVAGFCVASPPDVADMRQAAGRTVAGLAVARLELFLHRTATGSEGLLGGIATPALFDVLQVKPALGRLLTPGDLEQGRNRVVVLSHALWVSRFGSDAGALGRTLTLDGHAYRIVGVLPAGFQVPRLRGAELWTPLPFDPHDQTNRDWRGFAAYGRLAAGASLAAARAELGGIARHLARVYPKTDAGWGVRVVPLLDQVVGPLRRTLLFFLAAVGLVLLIGCANVANLLLARATVRRRELAVRVALGGSRWRLVRMLLTEGIVLAVLSSAVGLALAFAGLRAFVALAPAGIPRLAGVTIDARVAIFAVLIGLASGLVFGTLPALRASRFDVNGELKEGQRTESGGSGGAVRDGLVVAEVALALMLLVPAGVLARSFVRMLQWQPGFERRHLLTLQVFVPISKYPHPEQVALLYRRMLTRLSSYPGITSVGAASAGPLFGGRETDSFTIGPAGSAGTDATLRAVRWFDVSPGYFPTLGLPIIAGRDFTNQDTAGSPKVAIVNEAMARRYWPGSSPLGQIVTLHAEHLTVRIVGVVRNVPPLQAGAPVEPEIYWPDFQETRWATFLIIRTDRTPAQFVPDVRHLLAQIEPDMELAHVNTMPALMDAELVRPRFTVLLVGLFALVAIILAAIGIYGVTAYLVTQRTHEFGIRVALGASPGQIIRAVLRHAMTPVGLGLVLGLSGSAVIAHIAGSLLAGTPTAGWLTFAAVAVAAALTALAACYLPARRAARVDPLLMLRQE